uniref:ATPase subunits 8 n=1 Tax=Eucalanus bungii TaxID=121138 RepID=Q6L9W0_9MAXI|nr:ATPase subunits 8 [Eucalanus bungii]
MPQMSPMNWIVLFLYFNFGLYLSFCKVVHLSSLSVTPSAGTAPGASSGELSLMI